MAKQSLRNFQEYLASRLQGAARGERSQGLLAVQSAGENWLIGLSEAGEVLPVPALQTVPLTRPWFLGMANIRGNLYAVSDFAAYRGLPATPLQSATRVLLVGTRFGVNSALLVNRTMGLRAPDLYTPASAPEGEASPWVGAWLHDREGALWRKLDVPALLASEDFMSIGL